jgi:cellulose synthase/poly-beta-1,6-N-acetylglucosamine synthase-like glycosyltransferase
MLIFVFAFSLIIFSTSYAGYFIYIRRKAKAPWNLKNDVNYQPSISILVPAHNEEDNIEKKLANIAAISYPNSKIEVIVIDDASEDETLMRVENFVEGNLELNVKIVKQNPRLGKSAALNKALPLSSGSVVIVSDADTLWPTDILTKALPYMADASVGAVTGRGINENKNASWITATEDTYLNLTSLVRVGESKIHSTIRFEGGFCAYRKGAFREFDCETGSDDSGTALDVVQHNLRAILLPEVIFSTLFPATLSGKFKTKVRRASQLISLWVKCLRLMLHKQLVLPKRIAVPEIILFIFNPFIFFAMLVAASIIVIVSPLSIVSISILLSIPFLLVFARRLFFEVFFDNLVLLYAFFSMLFGKNYNAWQKTRI